MSNLFKKAKEAASAVPAGKAKEKKLRLKVSDAGFFDKVKRQAVILAEIKKLTAESELNADEIKEIGKREWAKRFDTTGINPESVMIESRERDDDPAADTAQYMLIVQDKYIKIDDAQADFLKATFGDEVVAEEEKYEFNPEMIEKHGEVISELIENCDKIPDADKALIITAVTKKTVAKGVVDKFSILAKAKNMTVNDVADIFKPVTMAKGVEFIPATAVY